MSQQSQDSTGTLVQDVPTIKGYAGSTGTHVEVFKIFQQSQDIIVALAIVSKCLTRPGHPGYVVQALLSKCLGCQNIPDNSCNTGTTVHVSRMSRHSQDIPVTAKMLDTSLKTLK